MEHSAHYPWQDAWRQYNGRAEIENRIRELGEPWGIKRLCCQSFWATKALHHLAIAAYNWCVRLQRRLGQLEKRELNTRVLAIVCAGGGVELGAGQTDVTTGGARSGGPSVVATNPAQTHRPAQLPCR